MAYNFVTDMLRRCCFVGVITYYHADACAAGATGKPQQVLCS